MYRNEGKTQQKIADIEKDMSDNHDKSDKLQNDMKQIEVDARKLLDEHRQAMVTISDIYSVSVLLFETGFCSSLRP